MKSVPIALALCSLTLAAPQQRPGDRETRGSVACSEVCGGVFICSRLDPKAAICGATVQDFNARYQKCQCGEPSQIFDSWPLKPKLALQPQFHYCSLTVCQGTEAKSCASNTVESQGCKEAQARHSADRAACACTAPSPLQRRATPTTTIGASWHVPTAPKLVSLTGDRAIIFSRRQDASILPYSGNSGADDDSNEEQGVLHVLPITTKTGRRADATIKPVGRLPPSGEEGVLHVLPITTKSPKPEATIQPYRPSPEASIQPYQPAPEASILPYREE